MQEQKIDTLSKYGQSFQSKVVSALLTDKKFLDTIGEITTPKFFENDANKWIISEILEYHNEYRKPPTLDVFKSQLSKVDNDILKKTVIDQLKHVHTQIGNVDLDYIKNEFKDFSDHFSIEMILIHGEVSEGLEEALGAIGLPVEFRKPIAGYSRS